MRSIICLAVATFADGRRRRLLLPGASGVCPRGLLQQRLRLLPRSATITRAATTTGHYNGIDG